MSLPPDNRSASWWKAAAGLLFIPAVGLLGIFFFGAMFIAITAALPAWIAHSALLRMIPTWPTERRKRIVYWTTFAPIYALSIYLTAVYVMPNLSSKYDSPYEDAPCVQGGGWGC